MNSKHLFNFPLTFFLTLQLVTGCTNLVDRFHRQLDNDMGKINPDYVQNKKDKDNTGPERKISSQDEYSTSTHDNLRPSVKRLYRPENTVRKRYTATDLNDNSSSSSLWSGSNAEADLFTVDTRKRNGDIILIEVKPSLKNEITEELKRAFPSPVAATEGTDGTKTTPATQAAPADSEKGEIQDKISSVIVEELKEKYLLVKGRKTLVFNGLKRMVEIQALVARRDISDTDTLDSNLILESTINIVR